MRTNTFLSVLSSIAAKVLGTADSLPQQQAAAFTESINEHTRETWEREFWPEWTLVEKRFYRPTWSATSFTSGAEVYHADTDAYYRANSNAVSGDVPGAAALWVLIAPGADFRQYVSLDQAGQTAIGTVFSVTRDDPRVSPGTAKLAWAPTSDGLEIPTQQTTQTYVWVKFRRVPPQFTATAWSGTPTYAAGTVVYYAGTGECYVNSSSATGTDIPGAAAKWVKQDFPVALKRAVVLFAAADHREEDGQIESNNSFRKRAEEALVDAWRRMHGQQGQTETFRVATRQAA